jgi:hypothetical protein
MLKPLSNSSPPLMAVSRSDWAKEIIGNSIINAVSFLIFIINSYLKKVAINNSITIKCKNLLSSFI